jgi:predicted MFS family arabinose efflux permease
MRGEIWEQRSRPGQGRHRAGSGLGARFYSLWFGQSVSQLGDYIAYFTIPAFVRYVITSQPSDFGLVFAAESLPTLFVGVFAGVWLDRFRLRPILITADLIRAGAFIALARVASGADPGLLSVLAISFLVGTFAATFTNSLFSFLPVIVKPDQLGVANARVALTQQVAFIVGPALGGLIVGYWDYTTAFTINAFTFIVSAISIVFVGPARREARAESVGYWNEAREGFSFLWQNRYLRLLTASGAVSNFVVGFLEAILVLIGADVFGILETQELSLLYIAAGIGGVLGALSVGAVSRVIGQGRTLITGLLLFGGGFAVLTLMPSRTPVLIVLALTLTGLSWINIPLITMRQLHTPDQLLGRVTSASRAIMWSTLPLGSLVGTWLADRVGIETVARVEPLLIVGFGLFLMSTPIWSDGRDHTPSHASHRN